jgi:hemoglobin
MLTEMSIYERLGGEPAVAALLEGLYVRVLIDPTLIPLLENIDIERLKAQQFAFISQAVGGPHQYKGPSLPQAHARLRIEQRHFDAFVAHLRDTLRELGAAEDITAEIMSRVEPLSSLVVNTPSGVKAAT